MTDSPHNSGHPGEDSPGRADQPDPYFPAPAGPAVAPPSSGPAPALEVSGVSRSFGPVKAVDGLSMLAKPGKVTALVGPNGCGKSTLMLMITALLGADTGTIRVFGHDPKEKPEEVRRLVGWMPDQFGTWDSLKVRDVLETMGRAYFMKPAQIRERVDHLIQLLDLESLAGQSAHVLSRGQKQRLGLARALVHSPRLLVLDEPASGLDPSARRRLFDIVRSFAAEGGSVLISSHILSELEEMADEVVLMDGGRVLEQLSIAEVGTRARLWRVSALDDASLRSALEALEIRVDAFHPAGSTVTGYAEALVQLINDEAASRFLAAMTASGAAIVGFAPAAGSLESLYMSFDAAHREGAL